MDLDAPTLRLRAPVFSVLRPGIGPVHQGAPPVRVGILVAVVAAFVLLPILAVVWLGSTILVSIVLAFVRGASAFAILFYVEAKIFKALVGQKTAMHDQGSVTPRWIGASRRTFPLFLGLTVTSALLSVAIQFAIAAAIGLTIGLFSTASVLYTCRRRSSRSPRIDVSAGRRPSRPLLEQPTRRVLPCEPEKNRIYRLCLRLTVRSEDDIDAVARLALQSVAVLPEVLHEPTPVCRRGVGRELELQFSVSDVKRGAVHLVDEVHDRFWDLSQARGSTAPSIEVVLPT
jgi:hypothetical protein